MAGKSNETLNKILNTLEGISSKIGDGERSSARGFMSDDEVTSFSNFFENQFNETKKINDLIEDQLRSVDQIKESHKETNILLEERNNEEKREREKKEADRKKEKEDKEKKIVQEEKEKIITERKNLIKAKTLGIVKKTFDIAVKIGKAYLDQDDAISKLTANYALSRTELNQIKQTIFDASVETTLIGVKTEDLVKLQQNYTNEIGRSVILSKDNMVQVSTMAQATGLGVEGMSNMVAQMELFGLGVESSYGHVTNITKEAKASGVSLSVATKNFQENLKIANTYTFKSGIQGVREMTVLSTKLRVNMGDIASFADKISNPEGAIQTAASLQVLGGSFASIADPINLLSQGITDMEGLTATYVNMLKGLAEVDKKTGEVKVNPYDRIRMKAAAEAAGVSYENMINTVRTKAKRDAIDSTLRLNPVIGTGDEETKNLIASLAQFKEGTGFTVNVRGQDKLVTQLDKSDLKFLQPKDQGDLLRRLATNTMGIQEMYKNMLEAVQQKIIGFLFPRVIRLLENVVNFFGRISRILTGRSSEDDESVVGGAGLQIGKTLATAGLRGVRNTAVKSALKTGAKVGARAIPIAGSLIDLGFAAHAALVKRDMVDAGYHTLAALVGLADIPVPGLGRALALGVDVTNTARKAGVFDGGAAHDVYRGGSGFERGNDVLLPSKGKPILLNEKDDVFAMKEGGAIMEALSPSNNVMNNFTNVEKSQSGVFQPIDHKPVTGDINLNINGTINLTNGGSSAKLNIDELLKNKAFVREITREIGNQLNRDTVGGKYMGGLNGISLR